MKILLIGEYSNVHRTLQLALQQLGHSVLLVSDGDGWKNYARDVNLSRHRQGLLGSIPYLCRLLWLLPRLRGFDVVQVINPAVLYLKPIWNRWFLSYLKRNNRLLSLGCYGDDHHVVCRMMSHRYLAYTDFYAGGQLLLHPTNQARIRLWTDRSRKALCEQATRQADCMMACLYEYWKVYDTIEFQSRLHYLPLPIFQVAQPAQSKCCGQRVRILFGVQSSRGAVKGTDLMLPLFERLEARHPDRIMLQKVENVPFETYRRLLAEADVLVDQIYSYTPAMNALEAMAHGTVVISGGEEEFYHFIGETELRPILNLRPFDDESNYTLLETTLLDADRMRLLSAQSRQFVARHHDALRVATTYADIWSRTLHHLPTTDTPFPTAASCSEEPMHIACATDATYLKYCATMLLSLADRHRSTSFCLHLLACGLSADDVAYLRSLVEDAPFHRLFIYPIDAARLHAFPDGTTSYISRMTYSRLLLGSLLPADVRRVIYLDCDILVTASLRPLWDVNLHGNLLGAVEDLNSARSDLYQRLGLDAERHHYFNAGVLLLDLERWRREDCEMRSMALLQERAGRLDYADQDILNILAAGATHYLSLRYNVMEGLLRDEIPAMRPQAYADRLPVLLDPAILHFTYVLKPWHPRSFHPYRSLFYLYFDRTRWKGERPSKTLPDRLYRCAYSIGMMLHRVNLYLPFTF